MAKFFTGVTLTNNSHLRHMAVARASSAVQMSTVVAVTIIILSPKLYWLLRLLQVIYFGLKSRLVH